MDNDLLSMKELTEEAGPCGFEIRIHNLLRERIGKLAEEIVTDNLGSIVGKRGQSGPKILLAAHMDEVAFMVTQITKDGFLRMQAQRVKVMTQNSDLTGVIGSKAPHVLSLEERKNVLEIENMFVDIGASNREETEQFGVEVGDPIVLVCPFEVLPNPKILLAKAWDNRAGCYVALEMRDFVIETAKENDIPYQIDIMSGGGTDAGKIHTAFSGVPTMVVSVAARYIHSHVSIVHRDDLEHSVKLLVALIKKMDQGTVERIKGMGWQQPAEPQRQKALV